MKTRSIAGHEFTLVPGRCYMASRPMRRTMSATEPTDVKIIDITEAVYADAPPVATVRELSIPEADALLRAFNDNPRGSLHGRIW